MKQFYWMAMALLLWITSCENGDTSEKLAGFEVFCEMVSSGAKPIALSHPMDSASADALWDAFEALARQYEVALYREDDFPQTALFPPSLTEGKTVILIYTRNRLTQYEQLKSDIRANSEKAPEAQEALARRFGRLLGYDTEGINGLLSKTIGHRTLASFGVLSQTTHLYYEDLEKAQNFYGNTLGLQSSDSLRFQISQDAYIELHPQDDAHPKDQPKSTAIALLTDQLPEWYALMQERGVPIKYTYKPKTGGAHDGFVAVDPEGYLLEFEMFKQHPENERLIATLSDAPEIHTGGGGLHFYGSITWTYHQDLLKMQQFYQEVLGFTLVADQGWTRIYQTAPYSYIGLVDECRGMEDFAESKAVELEWRIENSGAFDTYADENWGDYQYKGYAFYGPEHYRYVLPAGD
ncbi:VOC family protein [Robiginitalea sp.]|uniref:VOC family protein n=1 Tax=Robiginitalea sp. TaxID=1902411 RepID=UPI003C50CD3A